MVRAAAVGICEISKRRNRPQGFCLAPQGPALTKGARWRIFLLVLIYGIVVVVLITPLLALMFLAPENSVLASFVSAGVNTMAALFPLLFAALYLELRARKEGMAPEQLAEVFS